MEYFGFGNLPCMLVYCRLPLDDPWNMLRLLCPDVGVCVTSLVTIVLCSRLVRNREMVAAANITMVSHCLTLKEPKRRKRDTHDQFHVQLSWSPSHKVVLLRSQPHWLFIKMDKPPATSPIDFLKRSLKAQSLPLTAAIMTGPDICWTASPEVGNKEVCQLSWKRRLVLSPTQPVGSCQVS